MFVAVIEKVKAVTQGWKQRHLSLGGKQILLKAIAQAMPIYAMGGFLNSLRRSVKKYIVLCLNFGGALVIKGIFIGMFGRECVPRRGKEDLVLKI